MRDKILKYFHKEMNKQAGVEHAFHRTKIIATIGPSCNTYESISALAKAGVNVFRLNFSHGTHEEKKEIISFIRKLNDREPYNLAILGDLQGPKIRLGKIKNNALEIVPGNILTFTNKEVMGTKDKIHISYPYLSTDVKVGEKILIDDGKIEVSVIEITPNGEVKAVVTYGGTLSSNKGVNLPDTTISLPSLTEKDLTDLSFIIDQEIDWVALSFVRHAEDITALKKIITEKQSTCKVIAKIEMPSALKDLRNVILESDGVMVARGDLGVELPVEKIPLAQRDIIRKCLHRAKPVIVATQMMESMMTRVKPNRSEITDVANAVLEGADAVMLSGETAVGQHPALVVETMRKIIMEVESTEYRYNRESDLVPQSSSPSFLSDAICYNACKIAEDLQAQALIGMTQSGYTGFILSSYRPKSPLYVFTKKKSLVNQLSMSWGVRAFFYDEEESLDEIITDQIHILEERGFLKKDDIVVNTGSTPVNLHLATNIIKVSRVI